MVEDYYNNFYGPDKDPYYDVSRKRFIIRKPFFEKNLDSRIFVKYIFGDTLSLTLLLGNIVEKYQGSDSYKFEPVKKSIDVYLRNLQANANLLTQG